MRRRVVGVSAVEEALVQDESIACVLAREEERTIEAAVLIESLRGRGVPVFLESSREMRRLTTGDSTAEVVAVLGTPPAENLAGLMASPGLAVILVGVRYPGNVGFILRAAEVAGAAGVVVCNDWPVEGRQWREARRASIRADRFFPVLEAEAGPAVASARRAGRRVVGIETNGEETPWSIDFHAPLALVLGGESDGIPEPLLESVDALVRIPTFGVIPSYNVQAATSILLGECLRQLTSD